MTIRLPDDANSDLNELADERLKAQVELLDEKIDQAKKPIETNRRAVNVGLLKKALRSVGAGELTEIGLRR